MIISREQIVKIGLLRKQGKCAWCKKKMDVPNHNIQLCKKCRGEHLDEIIKKDNKGNGQNKLVWIELKSSLKKGGIIK